MEKMYIAAVEQQLRDTGIVVPFIDNDNQNMGDFATGTGEGAVDLYGMMLIQCDMTVSFGGSQGQKSTDRDSGANPSIWPTYRWPTNWQLSHQDFSNSTPFAVPEFQVDFPKDLWLHS